MAKRTVYPLESEPLVQEFLKARCKTESSKRTYFTILQQFANETGQDLKRLVTRGRKNPAIVETILIDWLDKMSRLTEATRGLRKVVVSKFFRFHRVSIAIERLPKYDLTPSREDEIFSGEQLNRIFVNASIREKALMSLQALAGLRFKPISNLKLKHLPELRIEVDKVSFETAPTRIHVPKTAENGESFDKRGGKRICFLSGEGCGYLAEYLTLRLRKGEKLTPNSYVITTLDGRQFTPWAQEKRISGLFRKLGLSQRPYVLKKFFEARLLATPGLKESFQKYFSGWKSGRDLVMRYGLASSPSPQQIEELRDEFKKAEPYLRIARIPKEVEARVEALENRFRALGFDSTQQAEGFLQSLQTITGSAGAGGWDALRVRIDAGLIDPLKLKSISNGEGNIWEVKTVRTIEELEPLVAQGYEFSETSQGFLCKRKLARER